jgi:hypothetical protein
VRLPLYSSGVGGQGGNHLFEGNAFRAVALHGPPAFVEGIDGRAAKGVCQRDTSPSSTMRTHATAVSDGRLEKRKSIRDLAMSYSCHYATLSA